MSGAGRAVLLAMIGASIVLQLASASLLKYASLDARPGIAFVALVLAVVFGLNFGRLVIWTYIHRRFPVSMAYPLSALFFPAVLLLAWAMGEPLGPMQVLGGIIVAGGVAAILASGQDAEVVAPMESNDGAE